MQTNALILGCRRQETPAKRGYPLYLWADFGCCSNSEFRNCNFSKITLHFVTYYAVSIVLLKNHIPLENPQIPQQEIFIHFSIQRQNSRSPLLSICGLGANVGCERLSKHSTCRDESHK